MRKEVDPHLDIFEMDLNCISHVFYEVEGCEDLPTPEINELYKAILDEKENAEIFEVNQLLNQHTIEEMNSELKNKNCKTALESKDLNGSLCLL